MTTAEPAVLQKVLEASVRICFTFSFVSFTRMHLTILWLGFRGATVAGSGAHYSREGTSKAATEDKPTGEKALREILQLRMHGVRTFVPYTGLA